METTRKRQRANSNGDSVPLQTDSEAEHVHNPGIPEYDLTECINTLHAIDDGLTIKDVLLSAAVRDPTTASILRRHYNEHIQSEEAKVVCFDRCSKSVWLAINKRYSKLRGSRQHDMAFEVLGGISDTIMSIGDTASAPHTSFGTKRSALETLRKIGKTICLSGNIIGYEVRKQFQYETYLEDAMNAIVAGMSDEECERMRAVKDGRSTFLEKMEELQRLAHEYGVFEVFDGLEDVIVGLAGEAEGEDEGEYEGEDEEEDEGEHESWDKEFEEKTLVSHVHRYNMNVRDLLFENSEEEEEWVDCYDSCGAPKNDAKSRWILDRYERKVARED